MDRDNESSEIKPIFILSTARSGTTSLSNHLCQHSEISGLQAKEHWGIHECCFLSFWRYYFGDLSNDDNFFHFVESFAQSDAYLLSGIDKEILYEKRPDDMADVIRIIMEEFGRSNNSTYWLNNDPKQSFYTSELLKSFPDAYFILLKRQLIPTVRSNIKRFEKRSLYGISKKVFRYRSDFDGVEHVKDQIDNIVEIEFEEFVDNKKITLKKIIDFLDLPWEERVLKNPYGIQSSFNEDDRKDIFFNKRDEIIINISDTFLKYMPFSLIEQPIRRYWDKEKMEDLRSPPFYYRLHPCSKYVEGSKFQREDRRG